MEFGSLAPLLELLLAGKAVPASEVTHGIDDCILKGDFATAVAFMQSVRSLPCPPRLAPTAYRASIVAAIEAAEDAFARELLEEAKARHGHRQALWDQLERRLRRAMASRIADLARDCEWERAIGLARHFELLFPREPLEIQRVLTSIEDWVGVLRTEPASLEMTALPEFAGSGWKLEIAGVRARIRLGLAADAVAVTARLMERHSLAAQVASSHAHALAAAGNREAAMKVRLKAWEDGIRDVLPALAADLVALNQTATCELLIKEAQGLDGAEAVARHASIELLRGTGRSREALDMIAAVGMADDARGATAKLCDLAVDARDSERLNSLVATAKEWQEGHGIFAKRANDVAKIVRSHWRCLTNAKAIEPPLRGLEALLLAPGAAGDVASTLTAQGEFQRALQVLEKSLAHFPSARNLWKTRIDIVARLGDRRRTERAREELQQALPEAVALRVLVRANPNAWQPEDVSKFMEAVLNSEDDELQETFTRSLREVALDPVQISHLLERPEICSRPVHAARLALLASRAGDRRAFAQSALNPVSLESFADSRRRTARFIDESLQRCVDPGAAGVSAEVRGWMADCLRASRLVSAKASAEHMWTAESFFDAYSLTAELLRRIREGLPTSVIRLGDGEGHLLQPSTADAGDAAADVAFIQRIWWGERQMSSEAAADLGNSLRGAIANADVLGVIPPWRFVQARCDVASLLPHARGIQNGLDHLAGLEKLPFVTSAHFHHDLETWNLWAEIFAEVEDVSFISCHDLTGYLWKEHGVRTRESILIPPEQRWAGLFRARPAGDPVVDDKTLLDVHEEVARSLNPRSGEVYLVAAGVLGKLYCERIKQGGGIGIDIGSIADYWAGYSTRDYGPPESRSLRPANLLLEGAEFPEYRAGRALGIPGIVKSSRHARFNIAKAEDLAARPPPSTRTLLVIGHPRCASGFVATVFASCGVEIGHEKLLRDGIASWMHVVSDLNLPYGDNASFDVFEHTALHVRDPADAVPSIMLENTVCQSFDFRRLHILRAHAVDIGSFRSPLDRAVASYVHWYKLALAASPEVVIHAERAEEEVPAYLSRWTRIEPGMAFARGVHGFNASHGATRYPAEKPVVGRETWSTLDPGLCGELAALCDRFGYALPWTSTSSPTAAA